MGPSLTLYSGSPPVSLSPVKKADTVFFRLGGLLGRNPGKDAIPLWIVPCHGIHTLGMREPIDAVFLDRNLKVVKIVLSVRPWTPVVFCFKAHSVIEFFTGYWDPSQIKAGDRLEIR